MVWLTLIVIALTIAWLASSAVRKQKKLDSAKYPAGTDPAHGKQVGHS
jgi:hypothetical protein